ncbi:hypothetical protein [Faecalicoccus pleomorphus]|uniref:hypothetical protein n=1 Tax=Faecalicoccus pleomorphus TaxID=1323 RepID=UPI0026F30A06|nr:hypothetical protein [Faecalicoccus pleomorphus]
MTRKKNSVDKLKTEIHRLTVSREKLIERKLEELNKTDRELVSLNTKIKAYSNLLSRKEEQEKKAAALEQEILDALQTHCDE